LGALDGLKVLDLSRVLAGPFATQTLSDLGATVWKIEPLWGDDTRKWGPPFVGTESAYYLSTNRGKKSVAINLKDPRGSELVRRLAAKADVVVENYKTGDLARFGLDYKSLSAEHPGLIYLSITGFGQTGPRAAEPGYDVLAQGMIGVMSVTGEPDGAPMKVGVAWVDVLTGLTGAVGILTCLVEREKTGHGQHIDLSLFEVGLMAMVNQAQAYLATGEPPVRLGNAHPQIVPYQAFEASDGWFVLAVGNDGQYRRAVEALGHPELWADERLQVNAGRVRHRDELVLRLAEIIKRHTRGWCMEVFGEAGVPVTKIHSLEEAFTDSQARARGVVWDVDHPSLGRVSLIASALQHMSGTPASSHGHPPILGEHSRSVLRDVLGLDETELSDLERAGVVR
jgi:crotonobetainyl-CoA:carnitine CoA-transferase CaiB-like acyl-CoA transferase